MNKYLLILAVFLASCSNDSLDIDKARIPSESIITTIQNGSFNYPENFSKVFVSNVSKNQWVGDMKTVIEKLGAIESFKLVETKFQTDKSKQDMVLLVYEVKHAKNNSKFLFTVVVEDNVYKVIGHRVKSEFL